MHLSIVLKKRYVLRFIIDYQLSTYSASRGLSLKQLFSSSVWKNCAFGHMYSENKVNYGIMQHGVLSR